jgi:hypothetical protein
MKRIHRGSMALDLGVFLILVGTVAALAANGFSSSRAASTAATAIEQFEELKLALDESTAHVDDFAGINSAFVIQSGAAPQVMISGSTVKHAFGGDVTVASACSATNTNCGRYYSIAFNDVDPVMCNKFAFHPWSERVVQFGVANVSGGTTGSFTNYTLGNYAAGVSTAGDQLLARCQQLAPAKNSRVSLRIVVGR